MDPKPDDFNELIRRINNKSQKIKILKYFLRENPQYKKGRYIFSDDSAVQYTAHNGILQSKYNKLTCKYSPALYWSDGDEEWYNYDLRDSFAGATPAIVCFYGPTAYFRFGQLHRDDGPAIIIRPKQYYVYDGILLTIENFGFYTSEKSDPIIWDFFIKEIKNLKSSPKLIN